MTERVFAQPFSGVRDREVYPTEFAAGEACPPELVEAAESLGALEPVEPEPADPGKGEKGKGKARRDEATEAAATGEAGASAAAAAGEAQG